MAKKLWSFIATPLVYKKLRTATCNEHRKTYLTARIKDEVLTGISNMPKGACKVYSRVKGNMNALLDADFSLASMMERAPIKRFGKWQQTN